ncbi:MAG: response regulator [Bacteroidota bacterium]
MDGGLGIPEEDIPHLFDRFYQAQGQGEQLYGGTGIGLALAKELTQLHNGTIEVQSKVGMGSTFKINLPIEKVWAVEQSPIAEEVIEVKNPYQKANYQPILLNGEKPKILIVEDNVEMNRFLQDMLSNYFYCYSALDGQQGLQVLNKHSVDLIISDVMMPNMDGFTFREKVMEQNQWKNLPFILLTARIEEEDKMKGLQMGVNDYITKPFSTPELIARVHNLLNNKVERQKAQVLVDTPGEEKNPADQKLLQEIESIILANIDEVDFKVTDLAHEIGYSQRQLSRILKKQIGLSPVEMILEIRLQKAHQLILEQRYLSVSEVRYEVGIDSASYFSKKFVERFGISPSQLLKT